MSYFLWGTIILYAVTIIFYIGIFSLIYYWHDKKMTLVIVPTLFTFNFFIVAFLIMVIGVLIITYVPQFVALLTS